MKVVAYVHAYLPDHNAGGETTLHDTLRAMVGDGWEAEVVLSHPTHRTEDYTIDGITVKPFRSKQDPIYALASADVVMTHLECSKRSIILAKQYGIPVVQWIHNTHAMTHGYLSYGCDLAVYNTEWVRDHHEAEAASPVAWTGERVGGGISRVSLIPKRQSKWPSTVLHPPIDPSLYQPTNSDFRKYITLVNLFEAKGAPTFWKVAEGMPEYEFLAVKGGYGAQVIPDVIPDNVTVIEHSSDITEDVYSRTKVILMPSHYESFGRVAIEAAASSIPTIAHPTPGLLEALGPDGLYANHEEPDEWFDLLEKLLTSESEYEIASRNAKQRSDHWKKVHDEEIFEFLCLVQELGETGKLESLG